MKNVLLIDDDHYNQENIRLNLIPADNNVDCVETAQKGLEYLFNKHYDLIISENELPDQSGIDLVKKIKNKGMKGKFILLTDLMNKDIIGEAEKLHIDGLFRKPYDEPELYRFIKNILS